VIDFSSSIICVLFDLDQNRLSFRKFVVEVDQVFFFSILHYPEIYSENYYTLSITKKINAKWDKTDARIIQLYKTLVNVIGEFKKMHLFIYHPITEFINV